MEFHPVTYCYAIRQCLTLDLEHQGHTWGGQEEVNGNGGNGNEGNGNRGNGNGNENEVGNDYNFERFVPARECTYQDFLKCQPLSFNGTEGVFGFVEY
ncbi:hypothetical protein Tco_0146012 [Tanacetum coccineum]